MEYERPRPHKTLTRDDHIWTAFEKHTLVCLMAKGMHREERGKRGDEPGIMRRHAYLNVATELNISLNGKSGYGNDIDKKEVTKMINKMLVEKKGVVGKGGYMERATSGRITRGLKRMWEREPSFDYDGSLAEWKQWRKESDKEKKRAAESGIPKNIMQSIEGTDEGVTGSGGQIASLSERDIWSQAELANDSAPAKDRYQAQRAAPVQKSSLPAPGSHDSFDRLPARLRGSDKFAWANLGCCSTQNRSSYFSSSTNIDSRPNGSSFISDSGPPYQFSNQNESKSGSYYQLSRRSKGIDDDLHATSSSYHFSDRQFQAGPQTERFDFHSDTIAPKPSLVTDSSPSFVKGPTSPGTARLSMPRPTTASTFNSYENAHQGQNIQHETSPKVAQSKSLGYKKPGVLKHRHVLNDSRNRGDCAPGDAIHPERRAMLGEDCNFEIREQQMTNELRSVGNDANEKKLPFNRLENMRRCVGGEDVEMGGRGHH